MVRAKISSNDLERQGGEVQCQVGEEVERKKKDKRKKERKKEEKKERKDFVMKIKLSATFGCVNMQKVF